MLRCLAEPQWCLLAVSLFSTVLPEVDHWPAPLVQAYARDAFGPRIWVDDEQAKWLVENLRLLHDKNDDSMELDSEEDDAARVADAYRQFRLQPAVTDKPTVRVRTQSMDIRGTDDDSSSGEDEEVLETTTTSSPTTPAHPSLFPLSLPQSYREVNHSVRPRYVGPNLVLANELVEKALQERLETKSKQNIQLLQTLPQFLRLESVRHLVVPQLNKWLQSPALASLTRALVTELCQYYDPKTLDQLIALLPTLKPQFQQQVVTLLAQTVPPEELYPRVPTALLSTLYKVAPSGPGLAKALGQCGPAARSVLRQLRPPIDLMEHLLKDESVGAIMKVQLMLQCLLVQDDVGEKASSSRLLLLQWACRDGSRELGRKGSRRKEWSDIETSEWMRIVRCVLFLESWDSQVFQDFWSEESVSGLPEQWDVCIHCATNVTDEALWIVLNEFGHGEITAEMALELIEELLYGCRRDAPGNVQVSDAMILWEMYTIAAYDFSKSGIKQANIQDLPRLAHKVLWWKVTALGLVLCSSSPDGIGCVVWKEHPTLRAIIKMATSGRYVFPTIDCSSQQRSLMRRGEQDCVEEEMKVVEFLFLPPRDEEVMESNSKKSGSRASKRIKLQQERKVQAKLREEEQRRQKLISAVEESIMLWDPDGPARRPPPEVVERIRHFDTLFKVSELLQLNESPDFLQMTVGENSRESIERAYGWLIPIVSIYPDKIARLPSSTSCLLLLKAYGADGKERVQLRELAMPLVSHVRGCLQGKIENGDAVGALKLLMSDVSSTNPDRRRCARKAMEVLLSDGIDDMKGSWMTSILRLDNSKELVPVTVQQLAVAAKHDRGGVLRSILVALRAHVAFGEQNNLDLDMNFPALVLEIISSRPTTFTDAFISYADLRALTIDVIRDELRIASSYNTVRTDGRMVSLALSKELLGATKIVVSEVLLKSICVLLSIWRDSFGAVNGNNGSTVSGNAFVLDVADAFMHSDASSDTTTGLHGAKFVDSGQDAITVDSWILLVRAHSETIQRSAALSVTDDYLPRLLICSGLPKLSLYTMLDRLGRLGEDEDRDDVFCGILDRSCTDGWNRQRLGRKLVARLSAYLKLYLSEDASSSDASLTFLGWLREMFPSQSGPESLQTSEKPLLELALEGNVDTSTEAHRLYVEQNVSKFSFPEDYIDMAPSTPTDEQDEMVDTIKGFLLKGFIVECERALETQAASDRSLSSSEPLALGLLEAFKSLESGQIACARVVVKWVPELTKTQGNTDLWGSLFSFAGDKDILADALNATVLSCTEKWSHGHLAHCIHWLSTLRLSSQPELCTRRVLAFLSKSAG